LAGAVHHELALLVGALEGHEAHLRAGDGFADSRRVGGVVLAALAREAIGGNELGGHQARGVAELVKFTRPVVCARAGFHADQARWQRGDELQQLVACDAGAHQHGFAGRIHAMHGEDVLGQVDAYGYDAHGLPLSSELMRGCTSHRGTLMPYRANAPCFRDGEVPFIR
jgi:hypothetical protein